MQRPCHRIGYDEHTIRNPVTYRYIKRDDICTYTIFDVLVVVLALTAHHYNNAVRGHRTGSNNSRAENYPRSGGKQMKTEDNTRNN